MTKEEFQKRLINLGFKSNTAFAEYIGVTQAAVSCWGSVREIPSYVIRILDLLEGSHRTPKIDSKIANIIQEAIFKGGVQEIEYNSQKINVETFRNDNLFKIVAKVADTTLIDIWLEFPPELHYSTLSKLSIVSLIEATQRIH